MVLGSIPDIMSVPNAVALFNHLGYPTYLLPFLGIAKLLGVVAIIIPGFPRIKEWAYAGFVFDLTGAMYSSISVGDPASEWASIHYWVYFDCRLLYFPSQKVKSASLSNKNSVTV